MLQSVRPLLQAIEERLDQPSARGLAMAVSRAVRDGALSPGDRLPPIRMVAVELGLSPTTVSSAWGLLARSGAIRTDGRRGTSVAPLRAAGSVRYQRALDRQTPFALDLSTGIPDPALLPDLARVLASLPTIPSPSSYLDDPVLPGLSDVLKADWPYAAEVITIVDGAMDALDWLARVTLRFGDRVVVENPCFPPLLDLLEAMDVDVVAVPVDAEGMSVTALADALLQPVAAVFLQPRAQNPTGVSLTAGRAAALSELLRGLPTLIIEDDSAGAVSAAEPISLGGWLPESTVHIRSFSKSYGPDLRLAAVSGPADVIAAVSARRQLGQGWSSRLLQRLLLELLIDANSAAAVRTAREEYARRRHRFVTALAAAGVDTGGTDGINVWVPVADEAAAVVRLASAGIGVAPGSPFDARRTGRTSAGFIRVTTGLIADDADRIAAEVAAAASAGASWFRQ